MGTNNLKLAQGDNIKIVHENGQEEFGKFHRYGETRFGAIAFFNGIMRFVDEQSLIKVSLCDF